jgi:tetratricopeptide (TPR) repeat protein
MRADREELVKRVFPQLRKLCGQRGVIWSDVDLRWGVTDEQVAEGQALPICLAEIERCRPYFIGLLGERYGPPVGKIHPDSLAREPWLRDHLNHSLTEIEILHAVLRNPAMCEHAFFYFRDRAYLNRLPEGDNPADFRSENADQAERLRLLKARIRTSGSTLRESYADPADLGRQVLNDFTLLIESLYPEGSQPNSLDREAADHDYYAASRMRAYVRRQADFDTLDRHAAGQGDPLVVLGESGVGKSALLANWALDWRKRNREASLLLHFIGASPASADWAGLLRRILAELQWRFDLHPTVPDQPKALRRAFADMLSMVAARGRVVLVIDALNQLEDHEGALDLVWLPPVIPTNVRLILSTLSGRPLNELRKRDWPTLKVEPLSSDERLQLIAKYLEQYAKGLSRPRAERISAAKQSATPLYLRALLEELRVLGDHEQLDQKVGHYLEARNVPELFARILARWEEDYESERPGLVGEALGLIGAARRGLSEAELLALMGAGGEPMPRSWWSPLSLAAEASLVDRSGLIGFAHDFVREAVENRYGMQSAFHMRLADYFEALPQERRTIDELPWQLQQAGAWRRLGRVLVDPEFFVLAWHSDPYSLKTYCAALERESEWEMTQAFNVVASHFPTSSTIPYAQSVELLLSQCGHAESAYRVSIQIVAFFRTTGDDSALADSLGNQATHLHLMGHLQESCSLQEEQKALYRKVDDKDGLQNALGNQGTILRLLGRLDDALARHKEEELICRTLQNDQALQACLGNQALVWAELGQTDRALTLHSEEERLCRALGDKEGVARSLGNQGILWRTLERRDEAIAAFREQEKVSRDIGNKRGIQSALGSQATVHIDKDEFQQALALLTQQEAICIEFDITDGLQSTLGNQAIANKLLGRLEEAARLYDRQEDLCRRANDTKNLAVVLNNRALLELERGLPDQAYQLICDAHRIATERGYRGLLMQIDQNLERIQGKCEKRPTAHRSLDAKCDICSIAIVRQTADRIANGRFRASVIAGFNPILLPDAALPFTISRSLASGADRMTMAFKWREKALADTTDWVLCENCFDLVLGFEKQIPSRATKDSQFSVAADIPGPHPKANANEAARMNIRYQEELARWRALPTWKRLRTRKPKAPEEI